MPRPPAINTTNPPSIGTQGFPVTPLGFKVGLLSVQFEHNGPSSPQLLEPPKKHSEGSEGPGGVPQLRTSEQNSHEQVSQQTGVWPKTNPGLETKRPTVSSAVNNLGMTSQT